MTQSYFFPWEVYSRRHAVGHVIDDAVASVAHTWGQGRSAGPEGGLLSSVADQLRFARFHLDGTAAGRPPLSDALRVEMRREQLPAAPPFDAVGLPWLLVSTHGTTAVTHGGNIAGVQLSSMLLLPEAGFAVTTLTNAGPGRQLGAELTDWCLENLLGLPRSPVHAPTDLAKADLAAVSGRYDSGVWGLDLVPEQGRLRASFFLNDAPPEELRQLPPPMLLAFRGPDEIVRPEAPGDVFGRFQRDPDGTVTRLLCQGRAMRRLR
jgi:CubicO group peptidase (beta-lactamase class C family)